MLDFHELPKLRDSLSYLYIEFAIIDRKDNAIEYIKEDGRILVPIAALCVLMLGPGTSISHAAVKVLAENGVTMLWVGQDITRCYAQGLGETRKAYHLLRQAELVSDPELHEKVVKNMYKFRFTDLRDDLITLQQMRGMEGARVKSAYAQASKNYGVQWNGRNYDRGQWGNADPINRALSAANALLNGICHAAIVSGGYSTALGFIHTGKQLSFVYDIADLYKAEYTIPTAFKIVSESRQDVEKRIREACREKFREGKLLQQILPDIDHILEIDEPSETAFGVEPDPELWEELY
jgi:CRISPR-associated protein Cas1